MISCTQVAQYDYKTCRDNQAIFDCVKAKGANNSFPNVMLSCYAVSQFYKDWFPLMCSVCAMDCEEEAKAAAIAQNLTGCDKYKSGFDCLTKVKIDTKCDELYESLIDNYKDDDEYKRLNCRLNFNANPNASANANSAPEKIGDPNKYWGPASAALVTPSRVLALLGLIAAKLCIVKITDA